MKDVKGITQRTGKHSSIMGGEAYASNSPDRSPRKEKMYFKSLEKSMTF